MSETVGQRIKAARKTRGLTQEQLGKACGMAGSAIRKYESGRITPKTATAKRMANALGCSLLELIGETEQSPTDRIGYRKSVCCDGHVTLWTPIKSEDAS